jgi:hypothetical protein
VQRGSDFDVCDVDRRVKSGSYHHSGRVIKFRSENERYYNVYNASPVYLNHSDKSRPFMRWDWVCSTSPLLESINRWRRVVHSPNAAIALSDAMLTRTPCTAPIDWSPRLNRTKKDHKLKQSSVSERSQTFPRHSGNPVPTALGWRLDAFALTGSSQW